MTIALSGTEVTVRLEEQFTEAITESTPGSLVVKSESLPAIASFLKTTPGFDFDYLVSITAVDYGDYFGLIYHLVSLEYNHSLEIRTQCSKQDKPVVPSVVSLWQGADFQEREIYDLMGISFDGHPNMKRISLWDGFQGHPLRKDYVNDA
jgi:NADH-quinone oxidoreductase subunit C